MFTCSLFPNDRADVLIQPVVRNRNYASTLLLASGCRESNSGLTLPKRVYYRCTTARNSRSPAVAYPNTRMQNYNLMNNPTHFCTLLVIDSDNTLSWLGPQAVSACF